MSDYISKSALLERFRKDNRYSRHGFVSENYIDCLIKEFPTVDEKEIIRKTVERIVERLDEESQKWADVYTLDFDKGHINEKAYVMGEGMDKAIEICKEVGGIE